MYTGVFILNGQMLRVLFSMRCEGKWNRAQKLVDLNNIPHPDESQVAAVRGVWPETPLVYPCVADKQTAYRIWARCRGLSSTQSCRAAARQPPSFHITPTPQTGHRWNAAPGILPQLCRAAAAL